MLSIERSLVQSCCRLALWVRVLLAKMGVVEVEAETVLEQVLIDQRLWTVKAVRHQWKAKVVFHRD